MVSEHAKWPHLENLDRILRDYPDYLNVPGTSYAITEKVHGFNARFGRTEDGRYWAGSRNQTVAEGDPENWNPGLLQGFVGFAASVLIDTEVNPGETFYGEWAGNGIQKGIDYGEKGFYLFGHDSAYGPSYWSLGDMARESRWHGLTLVPVTAIDQDAGTLSIDHLDELRRSKSAISDDPREGIVIVPEPAIVDEYGHRLIAKYKAPSFEERAHARREQAAPLVLENVQAFVDEYVTAERLSHVLDQVAESVLFDLPPGTGNALDVRYTGDVMRAMFDDIVREGRADFEALSETDQKAVGKYSARATKPLLDEARRQSMERAA